ncbi:MAG: hypothetical protein U0165_15995 [Polyangiaceae bacterium]
MKLSTLSSLVLLVVSSSVSLTACSGDEAPEPSGCTGQSCGTSSTAGTAGSGGTSAGSAGSAASGGTSASSTGGQGGNSGQAGQGGQGGQGGSSGAGGTGATGGTSGSAGTTSATCTQDSDCLVGFEPACVTAHCSAGECQREFAQMGTELVDDTPGDCHARACDGEGNAKKVVDGTDAPPQVAGDCHVLSCNQLGQAVSHADDTDTPEDNNDCTSDVCTLGTPHNINEAAGTECGSISGVCTGTGICGVCVPNAFQCAGGQEQTCSDQGTWQMSNECNGLGCANDACVTAVKVGVGIDHSCVLLSDQTVRCWGSNGQGQIGQESNVASRNHPAKIPSLSGVEDIVVGDKHTCAKTTSGDVYCWGDNSKGQIGIVSADSKVFLPHLVTQHASKLIGGPNTTCVMRTNGGPLCWGDNTDGLANADNTNATYFTTPTASFYHNDQTGAYALGTLAGCNIQSQMPHCWGGNSSGILSPTVSGSTDPTWPNTVFGAKLIAVGRQFACTTHNGAMKCWGSLPEPSGSTVAYVGHYPTTVGSYTDATAIAAGVATGCAIRENGEAYCWGVASGGSLGNSTPVIPINAPITLELPGPVTSMAPPRAKHSCFVANTKVYCAGDNSTGQLGLGDVLPHTGFAEPLW